MIKHKSFKMENFSNHQSLMHGQYKVMVSDFLCTDWVFKQYKFPRSRRNRIRKKWAKQSKNFKYQTVHKAIKVGDTIYVSTEVYGKLLEQAKKNSNH